jgi:release factor glutamine methyltransferase
MRIPTNKLSSIQKFANSELAQIYAPNEIQSFFFLLCKYYLGMSKTEVILNKDQAVSESELLKFNFAIKDLKAEKPIQYILGETEFFGIDFKVNNHTLIPRPETEELLSWIIEEEKLKPNIKILDIGTGSGCIAVSLSKSIAGAEVWGIDISPEALEIAKLNNKNLNASVEFRILNILNPQHKLNNVFDVIVSNPPYVLQSEQALMKNNVLKYEPGKALFVEDSDPLLFYKKIIDFSDTHLIKNGSIYFEINENMGNEIYNLLESKNFNSIELRKDLYGKDRMVRAKK